jgi:WD40 repeat protein
VNVENALRVVKIFVSSPSDVAPERGRVQAVVAKLNRDFEGLVRFDTVLWEEHFYKADRSFQPQIPESVSCDVLVSIFWTRIGTQLPVDFARMANGEPYPSGTAYELLTALEASKTKGVPDVYVFRKIADAVLPMDDAERRRQAQIQVDALEAFWNEWFKSEQGHFKAAFQSFSNTDDFERQIAQLLRQWLESHGLLGPRLAWPKEKGSPFRGLAAFEAEHAAVFFGRERMIDEARRRLESAAERGTPFLLIVGASGVGKSSLARAGVVPRLTTPGIEPSVDLWRVALMKPGDDRAGPLFSLATALFAALPELAQGDFPTGAMLADHMRRGGASAGRPIAGALARAAAASQRALHREDPPRVVVLLLVDQLEEIFAQAIGDEERVAFAETLKELTAAGRVWCIATLRADLYELLLRQPVLNSLKEAGASLDLGPPGAAELAEIVRAPAAAAGLLFETDAQHGALDERLLADAKTADSLPLLQFTLRQLYERRVEVDAQTRLTQAAYEALGGLQGAIAAEAERAVADLPRGTLDALPRLLRQLAEPARDGKTLTLREVAQADVTAEPTEAALANALLGARILIARQDAAGRPTLRLAHDAVLTSWPKAASAAQASREFYRVRAEVEGALARWQEHGRQKDRLIQPGVPLAEAERLEADFARELPKELLAFVRLSRDRARARQRLVATAAVVLLCLAIAATGASIWAYRAQQRALASEELAVSARNRALLSEDQALSARNRALLNDSRRLADVVTRLASNDPTTATLLSLEGLPGLSQDEQRPRLAVLERDLYRSVDRTREILLLDEPVLSPDHRRLAAANRDDSVSLYDIETGNELLVLKGHQGKINRISFSKNGKLIATASADKTARLWNAETGATLAILDLHTDAVTFVSFEDEDRSLITLSSDGSLRRWSLPDGKPLAVLAGHEGGVRRYSTNYKARRIATASMQQVIRLWDMDSGKELARPDSEDIASIGARRIRFSDLPFSDNGRWLLISRYGSQNEAILWDVRADRAKARFDAVGLPNFFLDGHRLIELQRPNILDEKSPVRLVDAETGAVIFSQAGLGSIAFKRDRFITSNVGRDKTARLWDAETLQPKAELTGHPEPLSVVEFIGNGEQILTASPDGEVRIWRSDSGKLLRVIRAAKTDSLDKVKLSSDGRHMIVVAQGGGAQLWDIQTGKKVADLDSRERSLDADSAKALPVREASISPNGKRIAAHLGDSSTIRIWDIESGDVIADIDDKNPIQTLQLNSDGTKILVSEGTTARIFSVDDRVAIGTIDANYSMKFSKAGNAVVVEDDKSRKLGTSRPPTRIWRAEDASNLFKDESLIGHVRYGAFALGQSIAVLASPREAKALGIEPPPFPVDSNSIHIVDVGAGRILQTLTSDSELTPLTASADGRRLLTQSQSGKIQVWDSATGERLMEAELEIFMSLLPYQTFAFSSDGRRLCWTSYQKNELSLRVWDIEAPSKVASTVVKLENRVADEAPEVSASFTADGRRLTVMFTSFPEKWLELFLFDAETGEMKRDMMASDQAEKVVLSPSGKWLLFVPQDSENPHARLMNTETSAVVMLGLRGVSHKTWFSPDEGKIIVASSTDITIWDTVTGSLVKALSISGEWVRGVAFSPDGAFMALGTSIGSIHLYDTATGKVRKLRSGSPARGFAIENAIETMTFSRDGRWLAVSGSGETLVIRNLGADEVIASAPGNWRGQIMFTPDNSYLVSSDSNRGLGETTIIRLFSSTEDLVGFARSKMRRCLTPVERRDYALDPEPPPWCVEMGKWPYTTAQWAEWLDARKSGKAIDTPRDSRFPNEEQ